MKSRILSLKLFGKTRSLILFFACIIFAFAILSSCSVNPLYNPLKMKGYEVIGKPVNRPPEPSDFQSTVFRLYPESNCIVLATVLNSDFPEATFSIDQVLVGDLEPGTVFKAYYEATDENQTPLEKKQYMLFINVTTDEKNEKIYELKFDKTGWLMINGDIIAPSSSGYFDLESAKTYILSMREKIVLPNDFKYYRSMEPIVTRCDHALIAEVVSISEPKTEPFFYRNDSIEKNTQSECREVVLKVSKTYKGDPVDTITIITSEEIYKHTIDDSTMLSVGYTDIDAPPLEVGGEYLFFLIDPPSGKMSGYTLLINNIQGYVPIIDGMTFPIQTNSAFNTQMYIEDLETEIQQYVEGKAVTVEYGMN